VADAPIDTAGDQRVPGLDGDEPAEPTAKHKDGPEPESTTGREEHDTQLAYGLAIEGPERLPVCGGWERGIQQAEQR
jgi:hypothetical protein